MDLQPAEKQLLTAIRMIRSNDIKCDARTIQKFNDYYFAETFLDQTDAFISLSEKELLKKKDDVYFLSEKGNDYAYKLIENLSLGSELLAYENSKTYTLFCERVYGIDLSHSNLMDRAQCDKILEVLHLNQCRSILEL